ncbi:MAG: Methionine--tRNA ligase [Chlamydiales bacterium]|nr:Methionine--tRNA ligase [Chlamydiales bacterium]MCH9619096.1 Methionine--tRNA ligase [Chlamydiales bacterium]MCH9622358.1 Methionine--tRNA ligase [Chlamydiales bacterium]
MKKRVLITAALPYANGPLHFGHIAGAYLPSDCYARFERLQGSDVLYVSGTDEYGVAITLSAELAGRTPREHVDHFHGVISSFFDKLEISFDHFSRTTCTEHEPIVHAFFQDLQGGGFVEKQVTDQLYSEPDKRYLADRYVLGICPRCGFEEARGDECGRCGASYEATDLKIPRSKLTGAKLVKKKTTHWFLLFDKFKEKLSTFLSVRPWRPNVINFAEQYLEEIRPRAITRDLEWGVKVPLKDAKGKVFYVWFDAPIGYISATQEWAKLKGKPDAWEEYWLNPQTKYVQFMGKDNIPFHAIFFPAMIMGQSRPYKLVDDLVANEFYNLEGKQFSKSEGWTIDLKTFFDHFQADQIRYTLAANAPETADSEFTWKDFQLRCNSELVGKFGNFINRTLVFIQNKCGGKIPEAKKMEEADHRFVNEMARLLPEIEEQYRSYRIRKVSQLIMELAQLGNTYFDLKVPWKDAKSEETFPMMETTIALCLECIKALATVSAPIIPSSSKKIWEMLGIKTPPLWKEGLEMQLEPGEQLPKPTILFQKIEDEVIEKQMETLKELHTKTAEVKEPSYAPIKEEMTFDDFVKLDLRVGTILSAEAVPKSKKLLKLLVDIGLEKRTVVSGISLHYTPEELVGKKVVLVANLKPVKLMGIESEGMVLAASLDSKLELVTLEDLPGGAEVS